MAAARTGHGNRRRSCAILPTQSTVPPTAAELGGEEGNGKDDDNEIEMGDEDDDDSLDDASSVDDGDKGDVEPDDDDDDESDVDLAAAVADLEARGGQEGDFETGVAAAPKTEHELDAYQTPIQELERHLKFQLTVEENDGATKFRKLNSDHLSLAGQVKHFMALDRTVVVDSAPPMNNNNDKGFEDVIPLDEGSLLLMRGPANENGATPSMIPLGRVFEVFGPVSRPLYTIRLSSPPPSQKNKPKISKVDADTTSKNNIEKGEDAPSDATVDTGGGGAAASTEKKDDSIPKTDESPVDMETSKVDATVENDTQTVENQKSDAEKDISPEVSPSQAEAKDVAAKGVANVPIDPWATNGEYGKILCGSEPVSVYYVKDEAKLVDTGAIMRISGKGCGTCLIFFNFDLGELFFMIFLLSHLLPSRVVRNILTDASNVYDEEITNTNEMYFSDDEKEREAKSRRKARRSQQHNNQNQPSAPASSGGGIPQGFHQPAPQGFHQPPAPQGFHRQPAPTHQLPQVFHAHRPTQQHPQSSYRGTQMGQPGSGMPPPPPPPPPPPAAQQRQNQNQLYYQY
jgi:rRNA processing protein Gar1